MFAISVIIFEIYTVKMFTTLTLNIRMGQGHVNMVIEGPNATSYELAIAMFVLSIVVCEIFTVKICMAVTLAFKLGQG